MKKKIFAVVVAMSAFGAGAEEGCNSARIDETSNFEQFYCLASKYQQTDRQLNQQYRMALMHADDDLRRALRESQLRWIALRNQNCTVRLDQEVKGLFVNLECASQMTKERTQTLATTAP